jgi:hypothetical protein
LRITFDFFQASKLLYLLRLLELNNGAAIAPQKQWYQFRLYAVTTLFSSSTNRKIRLSLFLSKISNVLLNVWLFAVAVKILKSFGSWNDLISRNKLSNSAHDGLRT